MRRDGSAERATCPRTTLRISFVMEQVLGHISWYENLRSAMASFDGIDARWITTKLFDNRGLIERLPGLPASLRASARALADVRGGLNGVQSDVLFFNTQKPAAFAQAQMLRTPTMLMTDVTPVQYDRMAQAYEHSPDRNAAIRAGKHWINALNFHLAAAVLPWSHWTRDSLIHDYGVPPERIAVVPPGVDTHYWRPARVRPRTEKVRLLFVGGDFSRKGGSLLVDVFHALELNRQAELHLVTRESVSDGPGILVHRNLQNNSSELLELYQSADVFVLPTRADCFSLASLEAMAAGLPVITTATGGIADIVEDGRSGYLVPPENGPRLGEALQALVENPEQRRAFGREARQRALSSFDALGSASHIVAIARRLAERQSGRPFRLPPFKKEL
jgi:hypothetical protein